eukprot:TRINITY_DN16397_c0_g3_i1.p1 TRINITY_DN16397_c0_g3~~TRINITY_DN16397_c0_g3_i1.p1  ORF type:complete len:759 (+),score=176.96 TRINITY_DN16397_c0_g3_i1:84-2279(+)
MDKKLIKEATKANPEPTMGHMYRDIASMTQKDGKTCDKVAAFIFTRLQAATNPHQIQKCLKMVKYVAANGHVDFQRYYQKKTDDLKAYANYRGAEDAVFGTSLNELIKTAAREAIEACAAERIVGKLTKLEGIGGGSTEPGVKNDSFKEHMAMPNASTGSSSGADRFQSEFNRLNGISSGTTQPPVGQESHLYQFAAAAKTGFGLFAGSTNHDDLARQMEQGQTGTYSGITIDLAVPTTTSAPAEPPAGTFKFLNETKDTPQSIVPTVQDAAIALNHAQLVIDNFVSLKTIGRTEIGKLTKEVERIPVGEQEDMVFRLDEKIQQKIVWTLRMNALICIEALARAGNKEVLDYFTENPEDIYRNVNVVQHSVKEKAKKCLIALGLPLKRSTKAPEPAAPKYVQEEESSMEAMPTATLASKEETKKKTTGIKKRKPSKKVGVAAPPAADMFQGMSMDGSLGLDNGAGNGLALDMSMSSNGHADTAPISDNGLGFFGQSNLASAVPTPSLPAPVPAPTATLPDNGLGVFGQSGLASVPAPHLPTPVPAPTATAPANDLDFLFGASAAPAAPTPAPAASSPAPPAASLDVFGLPQIQPTPAPAAPVHQQQTLQHADPFMMDLGGLGGVSAPLPVPPAQPAPIPAPAASNANDVFGSLFASAAAPAPVPVPAPAPAAVAAPVMPAQVSAPAAVAAPSVDIASQLDGLPDHASKMSLIEQQQALLASQIAALQSQMN